VTVTRTQCYRALETVLLVIVFIGSVGIQPKPRLPLLIPATLALAGTQLRLGLLFEVAAPAQAAERYAAGETMAALAREYDCGEATIWRALQGLVRSNRGMTDQILTRLS
jgi:hypothetical protein